MKDPNEGLPINEALEIVFSNVNRIEVINHGTEHHEKGRILTVRNIEEVVPQLQDEGRTLKIFI